MKKGFLGLLMAIPLLIVTLILGGGCIAIPIDDGAINFQDQSNELSHQLAVTQQQLAATQQQLAVTQQQLASNQQQLADTQRRLTEAQNQLNQSQLTAVSTTTSCDAYCSNSTPACPTGPIQLYRIGSYPTPYINPCPYPSPYPDPYPYPCPDPWPLPPAPPLRQPLQVNGSSSWTTPWPNQVN